jgi:hypothetical protein
MKKMTWMAIALIAAVFLVLAGCSNPSNDPVVEEVVDPSGVLGQVAGVVYDSVTGLPLEGVTVIIGEAEATTDASGTYLFKDVAPGEYSVTFTKDGYGAYTETGYVVDPQLYIYDDPFREMASAQEQIGVFVEWLATYGGAFPELAGNTGLQTGTWTYEDGVFVSGNGSTTVTLDGSAPDPVEFPKFIISHNKVDYTYRKYLEVAIIPLDPLTAGITGQIEVVFEVNAAVALPVTGSAPIKAGVEIYFKGTRSISPNTADDTTVIYGPYLTDADGRFETTTKLPANTELTLVINPFTQAKDGVDYVFTDDKVFAPENWTTGYSVVKVTTLANGNLDVGKLYLFTIGTPAYITEANVPNPGSPLAVNGAITITFSKPISTGTVVPTLRNIVSIGNEAIGTTSTTQALKAVWNDDKTAVTLTPAETLVGYANPVFPYSKSTGNKVADLSLGTTAPRAEDGSPIYLVDASDTINVFTEEAIKPATIEYLSASAAPPRAAVAEIGGAIKITFNKAVNLDYVGTKFTLASADLFFKGDAEDNKVVYVYTDADVTNGTLSYTVAGAEASDVVTNTSFITNLTVKAPQLLLGSTNLYIDATGAPLPPANTPIFAGSAITFTFNSDIPSGAKAIVKLEKGGSTEISTTSSIDGKVLTITPAILETGTSGTAYTLTLEIVRADGVTIYKNPVTSGGNAAVGPVYVNTSAVLFTTTKTKQISLLKTNLYNDPVSGVDYGAGTSAPGEKYTFAVGGSITLSFDADIPAGAKIKAELREVGGNIIPTGAPTTLSKTLTIAPVNALKPGKDYYLQVSITDGSGVSHWAIPTSSTVVNVSVGSPFVANTYSIRFYTQKPVTPVLVSANLYKDDEVANQATPYFPRKGTIDLTFTGLPATGTTTVEDVVLSTTAFATSGISAYARLEGSTVKVTPTDLLNASTTYYLTFTLKNGTTTIWSVPDLSGSGPYDPVYITNNSTGDRITLRVADALAIVPRATTGSLTTGGIGTNNTATSLAPQDDIVIQFNHPIATVDKAELLYVRNTGSGFPRPVYGTTVSGGTLSEDKKVLTIKPTNLLASNATFIVRLKVISEDGQILVYDSTDKADPTSYVGGAPNEDIGNTNNTTITVNGTLVEGVKQPITSGTLAGTITGIPNNAIDTALTFTPATTAVPFEVTYTLRRGRMGIWVDTTQTQTQNAGTVGAWSISNAPFDSLPGTEVHTTGENIQFNVRGTNAKGYLTQSNTVNISFAP